MSKLRFDGKVAIVTGAGAGLGKEYALLLASRGAKVVVNDLGVDPRGVGNSSRPADVVVEEIRQAGGIGVPDYNSVLDAERILKTALDNFGKIDILINNAGVLRDKSFPRISNEDWEMVLNVHLKGTFVLTQAAFPLFKKQGFGRIVMTSSNSGLYGNFGQANYSAAKMGVVGLANTVAIEGGKHNVYCNVIVPLAASRLTQGILPADFLNEIKPEHIAPVVAYLCHDSCTTNGAIIDSSVGWAGKTYLVLAQGAFLRKNINDSVTIESVRDNWEKIIDMKNAKHLSSAAIIQQYVSVIQHLKESETASFGKIEYEFKRMDAILYALSVGLSIRGHNELKFLYEKLENFSVLPSFYIQPALISLFKSGSIRNAIPGKTVSNENILHGEQYMEIIGNLPLEGKLYSSCKVSEVLDKDTAAVLVADVNTFNVQNELVLYNQVIIFANGCGNFGGPRTGNKAIPVIPIPKRNPDKSLEYVTSIDQAALFRLAGDDNPLHIDPNLAKKFGFSAPILHGLCTLGISVQLIVTEFADSDTKLFKAVKVRFTKPVIPGQTLRVNTWQEGNRVHFETIVVENKSVAITGAYVDFKSIKFSKL